MIGEVLNKYRLDAKLGEGGMGVVYKAWDTILERPVAVKMLHPMLAQDEKFLKRFRSEGRALAKLVHPNIVTVFDLEEAEKNLIIIMEYVEGVTLAEELKQSRPLPLDAALPIIKQVLIALGHAHEVGVIHRDIKPGNVMLTRQKHVKITDFGLAKVYSDQSLAQSTSTGGTLYYMPPEQLQSLARVDRRSDIYSIGMTFYEMLAGRLPFERGENIYTLPKIIVEGRFALPDRYNPAAPRELSKIAMKAIAKNPAKRYQSAEEMLAAITEFETERASTRTLALTGPPQPQKAGRGRRIIAFLSLLVLFLSAILILWSAERIRNFFDGPAWAALSISTNPVGATVFVNSDSIGVTPLNDYAIKAGTFSLRLKKQDYVVLDTTVVIAPGRDATWSFSLKPITKVTPQQPESAVVATPSGALRITSQPPEADIFIDEQPRGKTARIIKDLAPGEQTVVLKKAGYQDYSVSVTVEAGKEKLIDAALIRLKGKLRIVAKPFGAIYIDGEPQRGNAAEPFETELTAGPHLVRITHAADFFAEWETMIDIQPDSSQALSIDFTKSARIIVATDSDFGAIYVDGVPTGFDTPHEITLRIGKHKIELRRPGYIWEDNPRTINFEEGVQEPLVFTLEQKP